MSNFAFLPPEFLAISLTAWTPVSSKGWGAARIGSLSR
jgi:hypothetical protein